jgi:hypothetical protein
MFISLNAGSVSLDCGNVYEWAYSESDPNVSAMQKKVIKCTIIEQPQLAAVKIASMEFEQISMNDTAYTVKNIEINIQLMIA